jgi:probable rRNA maturation factor
MTMQKTDLQGIFDNEEIEAEISLLFVGEEEIRQLNYQYRDKDAVTDVLSFPLEKDMAAYLSSGPDFLPGENLLLGDIIICATRAAEQAQEYGHSLEREIFFLFVHGLLHLLGYDHMEKEDEKIMRSLQTAILTDIGQIR